MISIVDHRIPSISEARRHPEFLYPPWSGSALAFSEDFPKQCHGSLVGAHSLICATVAAGRLVGVDPTAQILFLGEAVEDDDQADLLLWAAGLPAGGRMASVPPPPAPADIFSVSVRRSGLKPKLAEAYRQIALRGRGGLGALLCFSAGNHCELLPHCRPDLDSPYVLKIGAATCDSEGREMLAPYSGRGPGLDLCAPSSPVLGDRTTRLFPHGPVIAGVPRHCGTFAFEALAEASLLHAAAAGDRVLRVASSADFLPGSRASVAIGDEVFLLSIFDTRPGKLIVRPCPAALPAGALICSGTRRLARIVADRRGDELFLRLDRPLRLPSLPATVRLGGPDEEIGGYRDVEIVASSGKEALLRDCDTPWRRHFSLAVDETHWAPTGGTSTAAPFVAGVASLLLGRRPDLKREQLIEILTRTAVPLAEAGEWPGARRVDAAAALAELSRLPSGPSPAEMKQRGSATEHSTVVLV